MSAYSPQRHHVVLPELELDSTATLVAWQAFDLHMHDAECPILITLLSNSICVLTPLLRLETKLHVSGPFSSNIIMKT